jgi:hypothetical protein
METATEQKIKELVEQIQSDEFAYIFGSKNEANEVLDSTPMPCVINILPISGTGTIKGNSIKMQPNCLFAFLDKISEEEKLAEEITEISSRMMAALKEFIARLNKSGYFEPISEFRWESIEEYDIGAAGVVLDIQLKEKEGVQLCTLTQ